MHLQWKVGVEKVKSHWNCLENFVEGNLVPHFCPVQAFAFSSTLPHAAGVNVLGFEYRPRQNCV